MEWIKCSDRLPDDSKPVLIMTDSYMQTAFFERDDDLWLWGDEAWSTQRVSHWMPLPEPPTT